MNTSEFLQLIEADKARKGQGMNQNGADIEQILRQISPQKQGGFMQNMLQGLGNGVQDLGISISRGSNDPVAQHFGKSFQTSGEARDADEGKRVEILKFLQKQKEMEALSQHRNQKLEMLQGHQNQQNQLAQSRLQEDQRHHMGQEEYWQGSLARESAQDKKFAREEAKALEEQMKNERLQKTDPGAFYLDSVPISERNKYVTAQQDAMKAATKGIDAQKEAIIILKRMEGLVEKHPGISSYLNKVNGPGTGMMGTLNQLRMSEHERSALNLFEKYQNDLILLKVEGLAGGGIKPNMFLERITSKSIGETGMAAPALTENLKFTAESMAHAVKTREGISKKLKKDSSKRIYNPYSMNLIEEERKDIVGYDDEGNAGSGGNQGGGQVNEAALRAIREEKARRIEELSRKQGMM